MAEPEVGKLKVGEKESCGWLKETFGMCADGKAVEAQQQAEAAMKKITAERSLLGDAAEAMKPGRLENQMKDLGI